MRDVGVLAGGVDDEEEVVAAVGDHQVVEDAAGLVGEEGIALASFLQARDADRDQRLQGERGILDPPRLRPDRHLAHMRDVEEAGGTPRVEVLLEDAGGILHRHRVAREGHHPPAEFLVEGEERGALQFRQIRQAIRLPLRLRVRR